MPIAVYPGTFDPISYGHLDIIKRVSLLFDKLIIAVYENPDKKPLFPLEQRVELLEKTVVDLPNVQIEPFQGLVVNFVRNVGSKVMVRGLRAISDFEREFEMALMNKKLSPDIELICLMTSGRYQFLSSSLIKEVAMLGGDLEGLVPKHVATALKERASL
ncbi:MAG: pantetheine-phosphate adenylyltransferase [Chloroflexota bacterium]|nr:pantetheine-phosphate adenylyltransferase [Chloroflexota bacterium]